MAAMCLGRDSGNGRATRLILSLLLKGGTAVDDILKLVKFAAAMVGAYLAVVAAWNAGAELFG
jgi:hypothetical protein